MQLKLTVVTAHPGDTRSRGERDFLERDQAKMTMIKTRLKTKKDIFLHEIMNLTRKKTERKIFSKLLEIVSVVVVCIAYIWHLV